MSIKAIPTEYVGYTFRSRTEARWASWLDAVGIDWEYEPEGLDLGGVWYLPDFWCPAIRTFIEIKGTLREPSLHKPKALACSLARNEETVRWKMIVLVGHPHVTPHGFECESDGHATYCAGGLALVGCRECGHRFYLSMELSYRCPACQAYDGDHHLDPFHADEVPWSDPFRFGGAA